MFEHHGISDAEIADDQNPFDFRRSRELPPLVAKIQPVKK
jgi:hypothetical protein